MMRLFTRDYIRNWVMYAISFVVLILIFLSIRIVDTRQKQVATQAIQNTQEATFTYKQEAFQGLAVKAKAYVVYDIVSKKVITGKNENDILPLASITKIMTAITALRHYATTTKITISPGKANDFGLQSNQTWTLEELLKYTLTISSNDGALTIADTLGGRESFVRQMNEDSTSFGLSLYFNDPSGLDTGTSIGGRGSATQVAELFAIARKMFPDILDVTTKNRVSVIANGAKVTGIPNTNQEIGSFIGAEASKTGFTDEAGGNLAVIADTGLGHPVVIVVLGSTREDRFSDVKTLYDATIASIVP